MKETNHTTRTATGAGIYLRHVWGKLVPAFYKDPEENHTAYAYTWVYSPKSQDVGAWVEFQNYGPFRDGFSSIIRYMGL